jgi:hypothetical protein
LSASKSTPSIRSEATPPAPSGSGEIAEFLDKLRATPSPVRAGTRGRLLFAMDATMSRQPIWDRALAIQAEMFHETQAIGGLDVQLVYFRGFNECRASKWVSEPDALARLMTGIDCRGGNTQIGRVLSHIRAEANRGKIGACVYVGDAMEENIDHLCQKAGEIGLLGVPLFMFQEGSDGPTERAYREIARLTGGAYLKLDQSSARMLRELLTAVAVYAAGGRQALEDRSRGEGQGARLLLEQLK